MRGLTLITKPTSEPVTVAEAKFHCKIEDTDHDTYIGALITVAREYAESYQNRAIATQTWLLTLDDFPCGPIFIPMANLQAVNSFEYLDQDGMLSQLEEDTNFVVDIYSHPGRISPVQNTFWPTSNRQPGNVHIEFDCGYVVDEDTDQIPQATKQAILLLVAHLFETRQPIATGTIVAKIPFAVDALLDMNKIGAYA